MTKRAEANGLRRIDIDIDRIDEAPVGGLIGTGAAAVGRKQVMQRIDAGKSRPGSVRRLTEFAQRFEITKC